MKIKIVSTMVTFYILTIMIIQVIYMEITYRRIGKVKIIQCDNLNGKCADTYQQKKKVIVSSSHNYPPENYGIRDYQLFQIKNHYLC